MVPRRPRLQPHRFSCRTSGRVDMKRRASRLEKIRSIGLRRRYLGMDFDQVLLYSHWIDWAVKCCNRKPRLSDVRFKVVWQVDYRQLGWLAVDSIFYGSQNKKPGEMVSLSARERIEV